jgi:hypothetical protein
MVKQVLKLTFIVVGLFLVLTHFTGFEGDVKAIAGLYTSGVKSLQGR